MSYYEGLETQRELAHYDMVTIAKCGEETANGIYFRCSAPHYENTSNRYIRRPNSKDPTFFVFHAKNTLCREYPIVSYRSRVEKYDEDLDYSVDIYESDEDDDDELVDIDKLTRQELDFFLKYYENTEEFLSKTWLTNARFKQLRAYIQDFNKYKTVLYQLNTDITPNKWQCVDGKEPVPIVEFIDNAQIEWKEKDYIPMTLNESTVGLRYEQLYEQFFEELYALLNDVLSNTDYNIFESRLIFSIVKEYLFCYHCNCGMMRCYTRGRWHSPFQSQWILFFCNICAKKWMHYIVPSDHRERFEIFPSELMSNVKFKYNLEVNGYRMKEIGDSINRDDLGSFNSFYQNWEPFPMLRKDDS